MMAKGRWGANIKNPPDQYAYFVISGLFLFLFVFEYQEVVNNKVDNPREAHRHKIAYDDIPSSELLNQ